ncbi:ADP-glyceromanno-heptose 6-epimerase [Aristophania vespae]|uniref:ADP-glyceromanno-heptose 6-epimerase n=1 Tax=Aristophania vespae TaxID=2697033 RepID=A0A6P1NGD7_9PROT|nr:ADP-glyceromanno-heptose 6-epimerase [Aristophania vespae]QHI94946.1 ADP-glyceromanno-heptose 6-epimerase [Aristophania vespae]QHI96293.1 ADP-glyceromanno-heptose 6-epimerase [Aristophania vespae]UMM64108.1 ADP-L-glycero-D-manno-heptose-6-epimerase [Aristophania vespae]
MIIVTGGAGFIGSCLQAALFKEGERTIIVDRLRSQGKWRNLAAHPPYQIISPEALPGFLEKAVGVKAVFHMGAISTTAAREGDLVWATNVALSQRLWRWCAVNHVPFIYASSAATYGAANQPEDFKDGIESIRNLKPLNLYGWSKQAFDLWVADTVSAGEPCPPQWVGLKFFNVYGPNEYHKDSMISVVKVKYDEVSSGESARLFRSTVPGLADGGQRRDFIWVKDAVDVMIWLLKNPQVSGLFNCGSGVARTYLDLALAVCDACHRGRDIEFIDMPSSLRAQYQSFTCANMQALRNAGYQKPFTSLEEGIRCYIDHYLKQGNYYL